MSHPSDIAAPLPGSADPDLAALPEPKRPWRRATFVALGASGLCSLVLMVALRQDVTYALTDGPPIQIGALEHFEPQERHANAWVRAQGQLLAFSSGYRRPADPDRFRLAPVEGNPKVWVEVRQPAGGSDSGFIPPETFVGRLVPLAKPGLAHRQLTGTLRASGQPVPPADAWLLVDGELPAASRWVLGVVALMIAFAGFSIWSLYRLASPAHRAPPRNTVPTPPEPARS